jgi:ribose 5-phosphate isomerase RpiB
MKIYIISDSSEYAVAASNYINRNGHVAILSESITDDSKTMISDLRNNGASYDVTVMICPNAKDVAISANKVGGMAAVACKDYDDSSEAISETRANVIVINSAKLDRKLLDSILSGLLVDQKKPSSTKEREMAPAPKAVQAPSRGGGFFSGIKDAANKVSNPVEKPISKPAKQQSRPQPEGDGLVKSVKSKGLSKALKEALGIED